MRVRRVGRGAGRLLCLLTTSCVCLFVTVGSFLLTFHWCPTEPSYLQWFLCCCYLLPNDNLIFNNCRTCSKASMRHKQRQNQSLSSWVAAEYPCRTVCVIIVTCIYISVLFSQCPSRNVREHISINACFSMYLL